MRVHQEMKRRCYNAALKAIEGIPLFRFAHEKCVLRLSLKLFSYCNYNINSLGITNIEQGMMNNEIKSKK